MATESKWERVARVRAEFAAYRAGGGTMTEVEWLSAGITARVAATPASAPDAPKAAPVATQAPKAPRVDRVWAGGDRDSDDITYRR